MPDRRPPRLVLLTTGYFDRGGVATRSRTLSRGFAERGWEVRVITRSAVNAPLRETPPPGVRVLEIPAPSGPLGSAMYLAGGVVVALLWGMRAQAFLAMQLLSPTTVAALCGALLRRPFVSLTSMTGELSEVRLVARSRFARVRVPLVRRAAFAVAQTPLGAQELREIMPPEQVAVVPTPTDPVDVDAGTRQRGLVLYAGRLAREKGVLELLVAWPQVLAVAPHARLVLAGGGGRDRSVEQQVRATVGQPPLLDTVDLPGWVDDLGARLAHADVFVLPSHSEGMSNALVEALAHGCLVVASRIPGNIAVVGDDYPLLFDAHDALDLAAVLGTALTDQAVRRAAQTAVDERAQLFSTPTVVAALERLLSPARA